MSVDGRFVGSVELTAAAATGATSSGTTSASGSTFVVFASTTDTAFAATPITDNKGNTYNPIGAVSTDATFTTTTGLWRCENGIGGAGHIATVHNNATGLVSAFLIEVTGAASSSVLDVHDENNVVAASPFTSRSITTTRSADVVLAFELDNRSSGTAPTWSGGYTSLGDLANTSGITANCAKLVVNSTGAQQSSFTDAAVTRAITWIAAFSAPVIARVVGRSPDQGPGVQAAWTVNQFMGSPRSSFIFPPPAPPPPVVAMPIRNPGPFNNAQFIADRRGFSVVVGGALSGSAAISFGEFGALTGQGALAGTATLTFGQSGTLKGKGALASTAGITFGESGTLAGKGALHGTGAITFGESAGLTGKGALAGTGHIVFGQTGTLTQPKSVGAITFGATGTLTGTGALAGTAAIVFAAFAKSAPPASAEVFSGGFLYEYERHSQARARKRREREDAELEAQRIQNERDREIAALLHAQEAQDAERADLERLRLLAVRYAADQRNSDLADRVKIAYVRALKQQNFSAFEALDRELQRAIEEEELAVLMILLEHQ